MKKYLLFLLIFSWASNILVAEDLSPKSIEINRLWMEWDSPEGLLRLQRSTSNENFWKLLRFYETQKPNYCGVASSVITLNSLQVKPPFPTNVFTQEKFFSEQVERIKTREIVSKEGLALNELGDIFETFDVAVIKYPAVESSSQEIKNLLISSLKNPNQRILALFNRKYLNQAGGGHWSPVAAYDEASHSFLVLDVARFKFPPFWVNADSFINALQTTNKYGQSRGLLIIERE